MNIEAQAKTKGAKPGNYVKVDALGTVREVREGFMSAGPASVYKVRNDGTLERLPFA